MGRLTKELKISKCCETTILIVFSEYWVESLHSINPSLSEVVIYELNCALHYVFLVTHCNWVFLISGGD